MPTLTLQPGDAASYQNNIWTVNPNTNYYNAAAMYIGGDFNGYGTNHAIGLIKFDLTSIPANATIQSATLSLWLYNEASSNTKTLSAYRIKRNWVNNQSTWTVYATASSWQSAGGLGANDREASSVGTVSLSSTEANGEKQISLSASSVQDFISGVMTNNGWALDIGNTTADAYAFRTGYYTTAGERPKLSVVYSIPGGVTAVYISDFGFM